MNYKKAFYVVLTLNFLIMVLVGAISFRFLTDKIGESQAVDPEIMVQYEVGLEIDKFINLTKELKKR